MTSEQGAEAIREANLGSLPVHNQIVYEIVRQHGTLLGRELHPEYDRVVTRTYAQMLSTPIGKRSSS